MGIDKPHVDFLKHNFGGNTAGVYFEKGPKSKMAAVKNNFLMVLMAQYMVSDLILVKEYICGVYIMI